MLRLPPRKPSPPVMAPQPVGDGVRPPPPPKLLAPPKTHLLPSKRNAIRYDWNEIFEEYLRSHQNKTPMSLKDIAIKYSIPYESVRNRSSIGKWPEKLKQRMQDYTDQVAQRMAAASNEVLDGLQKEFVGNELEIRTRHAQIARGMQAKATKRLISMPIEELTARDALAMLQLGITEERKAMGLPDVYVKGAEDMGSLHPEFKSVAAQMQDHKKIQGMGVALLKMMQQNAAMIVDAEEVEEAEQEALDTVGLSGEENGQEQG